MNTFELRVQSAKAQHDSVLVEAAVIEARETMRYSTPPVEDLSSEAGIAIFQKKMELILRDNDPSRGSIYARRTLKNGQRYVSNGTYMGMWVTDPEPPHPGDTVTNGTSDLAVRCSIPTEPGIIFRCKADLHLPQSPAYRSLANGVNVGTGEDFGVHYTMWRNFYVTTSPSFDAGERDARSGLSLSPQRHNAVKAEYRRGWLWGKLGRTDDQPWTDGQHDAVRIPGQDPATVAAEKYGYQDDQAQEYIRGYIQKTFVLKAVRRFKDDPREEVIREVWDESPNFHDNYSYAGTAEGNYKWFLLHVKEEAAKS